jgi:hypothetical protein
LGCAEFYLPNRCEAAEAIQEVKMEINWTLVATIAAPLLALFVGAGLNRLIERKPQLSVYFGHVLAFQLNDPLRTRFHTHSVVIKSTGQKPAQDVRVNHRFLPDNFNVFPDLDYSTIELPGGGKEIVIPSLVPGEQVSISSLYFPPITFDQINGPVKHSNGFAQAIKVLPTPQASKRVVRLAASLMFLGAVAVIYVVVQIVAWLLGGVVSGV